MANYFSYLQQPTDQKGKKEPLGFLRVDDSKSNATVVVDDGGRSRSQAYAEKFFGFSDGNIQHQIASALTERAAKGDKDAEEKLTAIRRRFESLQEQFDKQKEEEERQSKKSNVSKVADFFVGGDDNRDIIDKTGDFFFGGSDNEAFFQNTSKVRESIIEGVASTYTKAANKLAFVFGLNDRLKEMRDRGEISNETYLKELERYSSNAGLGLDDSGFDIFRKSAANFGEIAFDAATLGTSWGAETAFKKTLAAAAEGSASGVLNSLQDDEITAASIVKGGTFGAVAGGGLSVAIPLSTKAVKTLGKSVKELSEDGFIKVGNDFVIPPDPAAAARAEVARASDSYYHGSTNPSLKRLIPGSVNQLNEKRNLIYLTDTKEAAKPYTKNRAADGILTNSETGKIYDVELSGKVLDATDIKFRESLKNTEGYDQLSGRTKNQLERDFLSPDILEANSELVDFLRDNGVSGVRAKLFNSADSFEIAVLDPNLTKITDNIDNLKNEILDIAEKSVGLEVTQPSIKSDAPTRVEQGALAVHDRLINQMGELTGLVPEKELRDALGLTDLSLGGDVNFWLKKFGETTGVAGRYLGKYGTDSVNMLAHGAKKVADIQETVGPVLKENSKLLKKAASSSVGRKDVQKRIFLALGDRENAANYLQTPIEKQLYENTRQVFDFFTKQREELGLSVVGENYRPEVVVREALEAPEKMFNTMRNKFNTDVESPFSKKRTPEADIEIETKIIDLLPQYVASQAREFGYKPAMDFMLENVDNISLVNKADFDRFTAGKNYLGTVISQALNHTPKDNFTKISNNLLAQSYKNILGYRPKFWLQQQTQKFINKETVSREAVALRTKLPAEVAQVARRNVTSTLNPISGEAGGEIARLTKKSRDFAFGSEEVNVIHAFDLGFAQGIIDSPIYQKAIGEGLSVEDAIIKAASDNKTFDIAVNYGNKLVNENQFGANSVTKPEYFRDKGDWFGVIPSVWFKQFQRFSFGMIENTSRIMNLNSARALDILKIGDPRYTPIPEYRDAAKLMSRSTDDVITAIKRGEIQNVPLKFAEDYKKHLDGLIGDLDKQLKQASQLRGSKLAKSYIKTWVALSGIQFLFDGGLFTEGDETAQKTSKAIFYGSPLNVPTKEDNPFEIAAPSSPVDSQGGLDAKKLLNLVPGVGLAVNRTEDIKNFFNID